MRKLWLFAPLATAFVPLGAMAQVDRTAPPIPAPAFRGKIGTTFADSKEDLPQFRYSAGTTRIPEGSAPASEVYRKQAPFAFTGKIEEVRFDLE